MLCPYCKEEIKDEAVKCRHCGEFISNVELISIAHNRTSPTYSSSLGLRKLANALTKFFGEIKSGSRPRLARDLGLTSRILLLFAVYIYGYFLFSLYSEGPPPDNLPYIVEDWRWEAFRVISAVGICVLAALACFNRGVLGQKTLWPKLPPKND